MESVDAPKTSPILLAARFLLSGAAEDGMGKRSPEAAELARGQGEPIEWRRAALWFPLWGLAIGIAYAIIYRGAWKWFGEYQKIRLLPSVALLLADLGLFGYRQLAAAVALFAKRCATAVSAVVRSEDGSSSTQHGSQSSGTPPASSSIPLPATMAAILITLLKFAMLVVIPAGAFASYYRADWRQHLGPLYPEVIYRPLVLMPLWGRWAMLLALCIGRVSSAGSDRLRHMAAGTRIKHVIGWWFIIGLLTVAYSSPQLEHLTYGILIALGVLVSTYLANFALARQAGGQNENTVPATGLIAELAFLAIYLPVARAIYWY
jgi:cobalamin synthase